MAPLRTLGSALVLSVGLLLGALVLGGDARAQGPDLTQARETLEALQGEPGVDPGRVQTWQKVVELLEEEQTLRTALAGSRRTVRESPLREQALQSLLDAGAVEAEGPPAAVEGEPTPLDLLQAGQAAALNQVQARTQDLMGLDERLASRANRRQEPLVKRAEARRELARLEARVAVTPEGGEPGQDVDLDDLRALQQAQLRVQRARLEAAQGKLDELDALRRVLPLERELAKRELDAVERAEREWTAAVSAARQAEVERAQRTVEQLRQEQGDNRVPSIDAMLKRVGELTGERAELSPRIEADFQRLKELRENHADLVKRLAQARLRVRRVGLSERMGDLLRDELERLPLPSDLRREERQVHERLSETLARLAEVQDAQRHDDMSEEELGAVLAVLRGVTDVRTQVTLRDLRQRKQELEAGLERDLTDHADDLVGLEQVLEEHVVVVADFREFIQERVLWTRSISASALSSIEELGPAFAWLLDPVGWTRWPKAFWKASPGETWAGVLGLVLAGLLFGIRRRLRRALDHVNKLARSYRTDRASLAPRGLLLCALTTLPWPVAVVSVGSLLDLRGLYGTSVSPLGEAFESLAPYLWLLLFVRELLRPDGIAVTQFRWSRERCSRVRPLVQWCAYLTIPTFAVASAVVFDGDVQRRESLARLAFILAMGALTVLMGLALRRIREGRSSGRGLVAKLAWYAPLALGVLPFLATVAALTGWFYTAERLAQKMLQTGLLALVVVVLAAVIDRRLLLTRRKLAVEQARARSRAEDEGAFDEEKVDLPSLDAQTRQLSRFALTILCLVTLNAVWRDVLPALRMLDRVQIYPEATWLPEDGLQASADPGTLALEASEASEASAPSGSGGAANGGSGGAEGSSSSGSSSSTPGPMAVASQLTPSSSSGGDGSSSGEGASGSDGGTSLTLWDVFAALAYLFMTFIAVRNLPGLLEILLLVRLPLDRGTRNAISTLARYAIAILGGVLAFGAMGIGWAKVQWLAAAMTFGLAFGLQEIFANFISGLIILVDRPIRPGDVVTVAGVDGKVARVELRATTIVDWDQREFLVPNKEFITGSVTNWTLTDSISRLVIPVGVAYGSDLAAVRRELRASAEGLHAVVDDPEPVVLFRGFGDSCLNFELRVWVDSVDERLGTMDTILDRIDSRFREAEIEIAFPQLDVHLDRRR